MKKLCILFVVGITTFCSCIQRSDNKEETSSADTVVSNNDQANMVSPPNEGHITGMVGNDTVVAAMIAQGRTYSTDPSVAYVLLSSGRVLCFDNAVNIIPFTLYEAKILLTAMAKEIPAHKQNIDTCASSENSVVTTLIAHGRTTSASPSVAYVLLSSGRVLCFDNAAVTDPFTLMEARILLEAKAQGKLVYNSAD